MDTMEDGLMLVLPFMEGVMPLEQWAGHVDMGTFTARDMEQTQQH